MTVALRAQVLETRKEIESLFADRDFYNMTVESRVEVIVGHVARIFGVPFRDNECTRCGHSLDNHHPDCQPCPKCKLDYSKCRGAASGVCQNEFLQVETAAQMSWDAVNGHGSWSTATQGQRDRYLRQISVALSVGSKK